MCQKGKCSQSIPLSNIFSSNLKWRGRILSIFWHTFPYQMRNAGISEEWAFKCFPIPQCQQLNQIGVVCKWEIDHVAGVLYCMLLYYGTINITSSLSF